MSTTRCDMNGRTNSTMSSPVYGIVSPKTWSWLTRRAARWLDTSRARLLNHKGKHFQVRGPLNSPRPIQGYPVIAQSGASEAGREIAARVGELLYTAEYEIEEGVAFADGRAEPDGEIRTQSRSRQNLSRRFGFRRPHRYASTRGHMKNGKVIATSQRRCAAYQLTRRLGSIFRPIRSMGQCHCQIFCPRRIRTRAGRAYSPNGFEKQSRRSVRWRPN